MSKRVLLELTLFDILSVMMLMIVLQPLSWRCVECATHHERDVREE